MGRCEPDRNDAELATARRNIYLRAMTAVETTHIRLDEAGRAWIDDTNVKVIEVVRDWLAHGSSPES